jgi:hypothetical protein
MQTRGNTRARLGSRWKLWIGTCKTAVHWIRLSRRLGIAREWPTDALDPHPHPQLPGVFTWTGPFVLRVSVTGGSFFCPAIYPMTGIVLKATGMGGFSHESVV